MLKECKEWVKIELFHEDATRDFDYKPMSFEEGIQIEVKQYLKSI